MRAEDQKQEYHLEGLYNECKIPGVEQYTHLNLQVVYCFNLVLLQVIHGALDCLVN